MGSLRGLPNEYLQMSSRIEQSKGPTVFHIEVFKHDNLKDLKNYAYGTVLTGI